MSWGVDIEVDHGDGYTTVIEVVDGHTYNLTPMWAKTGLVERTTSELDGRRCSDLRAALIAGLADAWEHEDEYRALEPENGWGDFDGFLRIYQRLVELCHRHPRGVLRWNG